MNTGARRQLWNDFDPETTPQIIQPRKDAIELVGSDQAWIAHKLGPGEATFTPANDGVYDYRKLKDRHTLPGNATIVFFAGKRDPSKLVTRVEWIRRNWH